jgi:beta-galactosidase/beta-glucuronidase
VSVLPADFPHSDGPADSPRPEYPRPQFVRADWLNLNGEWEFAFDDADQGLQRGWHDGRRLPDRITVPFPYQSALSGIEDRGIHEVVWYARGFGVPPEWHAGRRRGERDVLLHFGAVDYATTVWVNGREAGHNRGGHVPFWLDLTPYLREGDNRLALRVVDRQDPHQPRGKQASGGVPGGVDYYCTTGIWQTVWLEPAPAIRIDDLRVTPLLEEGTLEVWVYLHAPATGWDLDVEAFAVPPGDGEPMLAGAAGEPAVARAAVTTAAAAARLWLRLPDARTWSPAAPHLYGLRVRLRKHGDVLDEVWSYAGMRSVALRDGRMVLNGEPLYLAMVLDQGYWPEGLLAAPSDAALRADVDWVQRLGFNGARKHQKIEDPRWLYWCDRKGLLVWAEMPNARAWSPGAEEMLLAEWERAVRRDYNHPCIVTWVPVNESMGFPELRQHHPGQSAFLERVVATTRRLDPYRPVVDNDGWEHTDVADVCAIHDYTPDAPGLRERYQETLRGGPLPEMSWTDDRALFARGARYRGQPVVLSEIGGFLLRPHEVPAHERDRLYRWYAAYRDPEELLRRYDDLIQGIAALPFVAGFCYTQFTDIEQEVNGLLTYDRRPKVAPERIAEINRRLTRAGSR